MSSVDDKVCCETDLLQFLSLLMIPQNKDSHQRNSVIVLGPNVKYYLRVISKHTMYLEEKPGGDQTK